MKVFDKRRWRCLLCGWQGRGGTEGLYDHYRRKHGEEVQA